MVCAKIRHPACAAGGERPGVTRPGRVPRTGRGGGNACRRAQPHANAARLAAPDWRRARSHSGCRRMAPHELWRKLAGSGFRSERRSGFQLQPGHGNCGRQRRTSIRSADRHCRAPCRCFFDGGRRVCVGSDATGTVRTTDRARAPGTGNVTGGREGGAVFALSGEGHSERAGRRTGGPHSGEPEDRDRHACARRTGS